jgi:two-component system sensor histidine kinase BarA
MPDKNQGTKPKILITEDDYENQKFLEMFLGRKFEVEICDSEQSFYEQLSRQHFDIILMDISLRGNKNGLELTRELRKKNDYEKVPVVCLTAHAFKKDMDNALDAGVDIFLTKPVENYVLMQTLVDALEIAKGD